MEIYIRKGAIYGFGLGIGLALLFVESTMTVNWGNSIAEAHYYSPIFSYIISILRIGVILSFLGSLYGWLLFKYSSKDKKAD